MSFCEYLNKTIKIKGKFKFFLTILIITAIIIIIRWNNPFLSLLNSKDIINPVLLIIVVYSIIALIIKRIYDVKNFYKKISTYDYMVLTTLIVTFIQTIFGIAIFIICSTNIYEFLFDAPMILTFILSITVLRKRTKNINENLKSNNKTNNLLNLSDFINNKNSIPKKIPLLFHDNTSKNDLLDRTKIIETIVQSIKAASGGENFVIGIDGKWGSGKTTIVEHAKSRIEQMKNTKIKFILDGKFDPWIFNSEEALLSAMYDILLNEIGYPELFSEKRETLKKIKKFIGSKKGMNVIFPILNGTKSFYDEANKFKSNLYKYLENNDMTYVFIIDNLDRADPEIIAFFFKLIGTFLKLPKVIYLLLYEENNLTKIFNDHALVEKSYIDKVIDQIIKVPIVNETILFDLYKKIIYKLFKAYKIETKYYASCSYIILFLTSEVKNLRTLKILLNSAFPIALSKKSILNPLILLTIELIHYLDSDLYYSIYNNSKYFISHNVITNLNESMTWISKKEDFNKEGEEFYSKIFKDKSNYINLLSKIFPYVDKFKNNTKPIFDPEGKLPYFIDKDISICSSRYFNLYFNFGNTLHSEIASQTNKLIKKINNCKDNNKLQIILEKEIFNKPYEEQKMIIEILRAYVNEIATDRILNLSIIIYNIFNSFWETDNSDNKLTYKEYINIAILYLDLMIDIVFKLSIQEAKLFFTTTEVNYKNLFILYKISYSIRTYKNNTEHSNKNIKEITEKDEVAYLTYIKISNDILCNKINLFENRYYCRENIDSLLSRTTNDNFDFLNKNDCLTKKELSSYINQCINSETCWNILDYIIRDYNESSYWSNPNSIIDNWNININQLTKVLLEKDPKNDHQKILLEKFDQVLKSRREKSN